MRASKKELMDLLGVGYVLSSYETCPWSFYDGNTGETCSAEVRMGADGEDLEAEIQLVFDKPVNGSIIEQIMVLKAVPRDENWTVVFLKIKGEDKKNEVYDWETKSCRFFAACTRELMMDRMPDFDALLDQEFYGGERMADGGRGGRKAPKIRPEKVMGMKKGGGF